MTTTKKDKNLFKRCYIWNKHDDHIHLEYFIIVFFLFYGVSLQVFKKMLINHVENIATCKICVLQIFCQLILIIIWNKRINTRYLNTYITYFRLQNLDMINYKRKTNVSNKKIEKYENTKIKGEVWDDNREDENKDKKIFDNDYYLSLNSALIGEGSSSHIWKQKIV